MKTPARPLLGAAPTREGGFRTYRPGFQPRAPASSQPLPPTALWQELLAAALLGTERRAFALPPSVGALGDLLARLDGSDPERALLGAVAALTLYRRAGQQPAIDDQPLPEPCAPDDAPRCHPRATVHLALMLRGEHAAALPEWLAALSSAGQRVPEELLPELLDLGQRQSDLRRLILPALGRRGRWLAAQNPGWQYAAGEPRIDAALWETGRREQRLALLEALREQDPARARELLAASWPEEEPKDRAEFLALFACGLSAADEPFLEAALDDRRKEVRRAAADLLARLPHSQFQNRAIERLRPLLSMKRGRLGATRLEVALPEACDPAMARDGIEPKSSIPSLGQKAWWLAELLSLLPPSHWSALWAQSPADLIQAAAKTEWREALLLGWTHAANRHGDPDWTEALLRWSCLQGGKLPHAVPSCQSVPPERLEALILAALKSHPGSLFEAPLHDAHPALALLRAAPGPWSDRLTREVVRNLRQRITQGDSRQHHTWALRPALKEFALRVPADLADELTANWPTDAKDWPAWSDSVDQFLSLLQFRRDMLKEIAP